MSVVDSETSRELEALRRETHTLRQKLAALELTQQNQSQLIEAIEALPDGLALFDPDERLVMCNAKYRELHPVVSDIMIPGARIHDILQAAVVRGQHAEAKGREAEWMAERLAAFRNPGAPLEQAFADGSWRRVYEHKTAAGFTVAVRTDITELKRREQELNVVEERLTDYLEASTDWYWEMDSQCRFSFFSPSFETHSGVPPAVLLGKTREETGIPGVDPEVWEMHLADLAAHRSFRDFRHARTLPDGRRVDLSISGKAIFDVAGVFLGYRGIGRDITREVSVEKRARQAEALLENAVESLSEAFVLWGPDGRLVLSNRKFRAYNVAIIDYTRPGTRLEDFYRAAVERDLVSAAAAEVWLTDRIRQLENPGKPFEVRRSDGRWLLVNDQKLPDGSTVTISTDITSRKVAEAALQVAHDELEDRVVERTSEINRINADLRANQALLAAVLDNLPDLTGLRGPDGKYLLVNKAFEDWYGMPRDRILGRSAEELWPSEIAEEFHRREAQVIESRETLHRHTEIEFPDARTRTVRSVRFPVFVDDDTLLGVGFINTDISDLTRAEREAVEKSSLLQTILDATPAIIGLRDREGRFLFANRRLKEFFGISQDEFLGKKGVDVFPERGGGVVDELARQVRETGAPVAGYEWHANDPEEHVFLMTVVPMFGSDGALSGTVGIGIDISERKHLEEQLRQSQKMEAIGQLTGGVSHDFNNLLGVIIGNLEFLEELLPSGDSAAGADMRELLQSALAASEKGAMLNKQLLAFARRQTLAPKSIDLGNQIAGMVDLLRRTLGATIDVDVVSPATLHRCVADPAQVEAALLNLAINARDAMPQGGTMTIELSNAQLGDTGGQTGGNSVSDSYVMMAVRDTGQGIPPDVLEHVFEPFYTTKDVGQGSGLGLSMVFGFAKQSNGHVSIESEEAVGTTVKLYLPRATGDALSTDTDDCGTVPGAQGETLILVEDDPEMRSLSARLLEGLGYRVSQASDGRSALSVLDAASEVDILVTDVVLSGGMDGPSIAAEAKKRYPKLKVLFMSGYPRDAMEGEGWLDPGVQLLEKPFRQSEIARKLRQTIEV